MLIPEDDLEIMKAFSDFIKERDNEEKKSRLFSGGYMKGTIFMLAMKKAEVLRDFEMRGSIEWFFLKYEKAHERDKQKWFVDFIDHCKENKFSLTDLTEYVNVQSLDRDSFKKAA